MGSAAIVSCCDLVVVGTINTNKSPEIRKIIYTKDHNY